VYEELTATERRCAQLLADGADLWTASASVGGHLLATWNAFVLQTLGAGLLHADYAADAGTVGFVPPVSFDQAWSCFRRRQVGSARPVRRTTIPISI
jgi:hypothetical protein